MIELRGLWVCNEVMYCDVWQISYKRNIRKCNLKFYIIISKLLLPSDIQTSRALKIVNTFFEIIVTFSSK